MSSPELDVAQLSDGERSALDTYTAVTGQELSQAIPLLRRSQWNVQVGSRKLFYPLSYRRYLLMDVPIDCRLQIFRR